MNEIQIFDYKGKTVRTVEIDGEPWFVLKDVCDILGISDAHTVAARLDEDERGLTTVIDKMGRSQKTTTVSESGLYNVILRSDKPEAKPFRKHVTYVILPSIRKTGGYVADEDKFAEYYLQGYPQEVKNLFKVTLKSMAYLNGEVKKLNNELTVKDNVIEQSKPKVEFYNAVADTKDCIKVREFAKLCHKSDIDIGQNKLYKWFRNNGYMNAHNEPYQQYINAGYFIISEFHYFIGSEPKVSITPYVTGKGQQYFLKKLKDAFKAA